MLARIQARACKPKQSEEDAMIVEFCRWGNSLAVRIPKPAAEKARMKEGDSLEIETTEGQIELRRITSVPLTGPRQVCGRSLTAWVDTVTARWPAGWCVTR